MLTSVIWVIWIFKFIKYTTHNIINYFDIPSEIRYTLYEYILNNIVTNEIINTVIFKKQYFNS